MHVYQEDQGETVNSTGESLAPAGSLLTDRTGLVHLTENEPNPAERINTCMFMTVPLQHRVAGLHGGRWQVSSGGEL